MISFNIYSLVNKKLVVLAREVMRDSNIYMQLDSFYNSQEALQDFGVGYGLEYEDEYENENENEDENEDEYEEDEE